MARSAALGTMAAKNVPAGKGSETKAPDALEKIAQVMSSKAGPSHTHPGTPAPLPSDATPASTPAGFRAAFWLATAAPSATGTDDGPAEKWVGTLEQSTYFTK